MSGVNGSGSGLPVARVPHWLSIPGLVHGFLGRAGGVSAGPFASLNVSYGQGDEPAAVDENRRRVATTLTPQGRLVAMQQTHGDRVTVVDSPIEPVGSADGMVTARAGAVLSVLTADCVPILLTAPRQRVVAAVHAGWRGTVAGIAVRALERLERDFGVVPSEIEAALGPAIGGCCYEVTREIAEQFSSRWGDLSEDAWRPAGDRGWLDLRRANTLLLQRSGVREQQVHRIGPCTRCAAHDYFSHRASGGRTGRQISYIGLTI